MVSAANWVQQRVGHLNALRHLYVADYVTFRHLLKCSENEMKARGTNATGSAGGMADAFVLKNADSQDDLQNIYSRAMSSGQAVCTTFAGSAAYVLSEPGGPSVEIIAHNAKKAYRGTHLFVAVGRSNVDITDQSWIKADCIIVDSWAHALGYDQCDFPATQFKVSPIADDTARLSLELNASALATAKPTLNSPFAAGGQPRAKKCYVTTATCTALGLGDDCPELEILRTVRDHVLLNDPETAGEVAAYYALAPDLVRLIDDSTESREIYAAIYGAAIEPAVAAAAAGDLNAAAQIFLRWIAGLKAGQGPQQLIATARGDNESGARL